MYQFHHGDKTLLLYNKIAVLDCICLLLEKKEPTDDTKMFIHF